MTTRIYAQRGLTLIELLIVIAIIGVLAGILIPLYQGSVRKANEAAAVAAINTIKVAQTKFLADGNRYGSFSELHNDGFLDKRFNVVEPQIRGYIFRLELLDNQSRKAASFKLNVDPESFEGVGATGHRFYFTEPDAAIFYSKDKPASADDEIL
jgi:prepilin-type N-terminal cleavage/methylation domain-containing protein